MDLTRTDPEPADSESMDSVRVGPEPAEPAPVGLVPANPAPAEPAPVGLVLVDLGPGDPRMAADVAPLIRALRPRLSADAFTAFAEEGHAQGLRFTVAYDTATGRALGAATHRVLATSRGRLLFVDDLVTAAGSRGRGIGAHLMAELERRGRAEGCVRLELDSGTTNVDAHRFYHARRLTVAAFHFGRELDPDPGGGRSGTDGGSGTDEGSSRDEDPGTDADPATDRGSAGR
ncbi:GNAT family N-acetyltransferase [Streptomyces bacillaris]|uniref:GNAT family N-acetyltransferase n=1 Tax=Streptomyces bacillaris TaxID=68179 RepID=UPI0037FF4E3A